MKKGRLQGWEVTDDALFEKCGLSVRIVNEGEETNLKVTTPVDCDRRIYSASV